MNQKPFTPDSPQPASTSEELWYQPALFRQAGTLEGIDMFTLDPPKAVPIVRPQQGQLIEGTLLAAQVPWKDKLYMVVGTADGEIAACTDVTLRTDFPTPTRVRLKGVILESERTPDTSAWEVHSAFPIGKDCWIPASNQHLELRTLPADKWIDYIESRLIPNFRTQLQQDRLYCAQLAADYATFNPLAPEPLTPTAALTLAKFFMLGQAFEEAYVEVHRPSHALDSPEHRQAAAQLASFEQKAQMPDAKEKLQGTASSMLEWNRRLGGAIAEQQTNINMLESSLSEAEDLINRLRPLGKANVTMEQSMIRDCRQRLLPTFIAAESVRVTAKRGPKLRM